MGESSSDDFAAIHVVSNFRHTSFPIVAQVVYRNEAHFYNDFTIEGGGLPRPECYHVGAKLGTVQVNYAHGT